MSATPDTDALAALRLSLAETARRSERLGEKLVSEAREALALGERLLEQAARLDASASALAEPGVVRERPPLRVEPEPEPPEETVPREGLLRPTEPPEEEVEEEVERAPLRREPRVGPVAADPRVAGEQQKVKDAAKVAARLGRFTRHDFVEHADVSMIAAGRLLAMLQEKGVLDADGREFVFVLPPGAEREVRITPQREGVALDTAAEIEVARSDRSGAAGEINREVILSWLQEHGASQLAEIVEGVRLSQPVVSRHLRVLIEERRVDKDGKVYDARPDRETAPEEPPAPQTTPWREGQPREIQILNTVRDYVIQQKRPFSLTQCAEAVELPATIVLPVLRTLEDRGEVSDESPGPDLLLFEYTPGQPPAGARSGGGTSQISVKRGEAIAGTGKPVKAADKRVQEIIDAAVARGATVKHAANGHFEILVPPNRSEPNGKRVLIAATPRSDRSVMNDRARLRRAGLEIT